MADYLARVAAAGARTASPIRPPVTGSPFASPAREDAVAPISAVEAESMASSGHQHKKADREISVKLVPRDKRPIEAVRAPVAGVPRLPTAEATIPGLPTAESTIPAASTSASPKQVVSTKTLAPVAMPVDNAVPLERVSETLTVKQSPRPIVMPEALAKSQVAPTPSLPPSSITTRVRMPRGLRPPPSTTVERAEPKPIDSTSISAPLAGTSPISRRNSDPGRVVASAQRENDAAEFFEVIHESVVLAPRNDERQRPIALATSEPRPMPTLHLASHTEDVVNLMAEPRPRKIVPETPMPFIEPAATLLPGIPATRTDPRPARLTIGRIDVDVHVQPGVPAAAPVPKPVAPEPGNVLDHRFLDRFGLRQ